MQHPSDRSAGACADIVAVRAMVPVTHIRRRKHQPILATPWATSSQLDRCLRPVMPSATTAESRLSIAPSRAIANASGKAERICRQVKGRQRRGRQRMWHSAEARADGCDIEIKHCGYHMPSNNGDKKARRLAGELGAGRR